MDEKIYNQKYFSFKKSSPTKEWCRKVQRSNFAKEMANYEVQGNKTIIENPKYLGHKIQNSYLWQSGRGSNKREGYCDIIHIMLLCSSSLDENGWLEEISFFFSIEVDRMRIAYITPS